MIIFALAKKGEVKKAFRDFWDRKVRKVLKFPKTYKFYSLKDSGITAMLRNCDTLTVRDQARHSSILMTNKYTPQDIQNANELLLNYEGSFSRAGHKDIFDVAYPLFQTFRSNLTVSSPLIKLRVFLYYSRKYAHYPD